MSRHDRDWAAVVDRLLAGERAAFVELSRLITGFLCSWRAYDQRDEWDDLIQEVILTVAQDYSAGKVRQRGALAGYIRTIARRRFVDLIRRSRPNFVDWDPDELPRPGPDARDLGLREDVERLPEKQRIAVDAVYFKGMTQEQAARYTGMPLGNLKRYLREALANLRKTRGPHGKK